MSKDLKEGETTRSVTIEIIEPGPGHLPAVRGSKSAPRRAWRLWALVPSLIVAALLYLPLFGGKNAPTIDDAVAVAASGMMAPQVGTFSGGDTTYIKAAVLTSGSGNWSVPADALGPSRIYAWGPGGAGASGNLTAPRAGGGSGALCIHTSQVLTPGASVAYVVGTSGTATTILGGTANSGTNGASGANTAGTGGSSSGCDTNISGSTGGTGVSINSGTGIGVANDGSNGANSTNKGKGGRASAASQTVHAGGGGAGAPSPSDGGPNGGRGGDGASGASGSARYSTSGLDGTVPGGGGGAGSAVDSVENGGNGAGAAGLILILYLASTP